MRHTRRTFLAATVSAIAFSAVPACRRNVARSVVLYTSVDEPILRPVLAAFERSSGIEVLPATDTEATKSTGLIERLLLEKDSPRADVWWSSEPLGVIALARAGCLAPLDEALVRDLPRPAHLRDASGFWMGLAPRARVIASASRRLKTPPTRLNDLLDPALKGRIGIANPAFGTTRVHLAALVVEHGAKATRAWLSALHANGLKVFDGNSAVVRAIANAEIDAGLTDSDDCHAAAANGWPITMSFEPLDPSGSPGSLRSRGPLAIPNTVALIRGGPNPGPAANLVRFILCEQVEELLAASDSRNTPVHAAVAARHPGLAIPDAWYVDPARLADALAESSSMAREVLGLA